MTNTTDISQLLKMYQTAPAYQSMQGGDYDALQKALYDSATAGLATQEQQWRDESNQSMADRGIWSSGIAERAQNDITDQLADTYAQAGADAATARYSMQQQDLQSANDYGLNASNNYNSWLSNMYGTSGSLENDAKQAQYNYELGKESNAFDYTLGKESNANTAQSNLYNYELGKESNANNATANQYDYELGKESNANSYDLGLKGYENTKQSIDDSYALGRAQLLNDAEANASSAQWQAQWSPANFLSGIWNGTGGTISSGSSGGGWNFMI